MWQSPQEKDVKRPAEHKDYVAASLQLIPNYTHKCGLLSTDPVCYAAPFVPVCIDNRQQ